MCTVAGYAGRKQAAPVLLELLRRLEGFSDGSYSGIATLHEGRIHMAKCVGTVDALCAQTDAGQLPGTVGIAHSRPPMGGDREWAHPFLNKSGTVAYIANGHIGFFEPRRDRNAIVARLLGRGVSFRSACPPFASQTAPPALPDGRAAHESEIMCHLISLLADEGAAPPEAMRRAFISHPAEIVGLCLFSGLPGEIVASRFNQPLTMGFADGEVYMATTALAFQDRPAIANVFPMPASATAVVSPDRMEVRPFRPSPGPVAQGFPWATGCRAVLAALAAAPSGATIEDLKQATAGLWPANAAPQKDMMVYEIVRALRADGSVRIQTSPWTRSDGVTIRRSRVILQAAPDEGGPRPTAAYRPRRESAARMRSMQ